MGGRTATTRLMGVFRHCAKNTSSQTWKGVPPGIMKMQLRILRLRLRMTVPREMMRLIQRAVAMGEFSGQVFRLR